MNWETCFLIFFVRYVILPPYIPRSVADLDHCSNARLSDRPFWRCQVRCVEIRLGSMRSWCSTALQIDSMALLSSSNWALGRWFGPNVPIEKFDVSSSDFLDLIGTHAQQIVSQRFRFAYLGVASALTPTGLDNKVVGGPILSPNLSSKIPESLLTSIPIQYINIYIFRIISRGNNFCSQEHIL